MTALIILFCIVLFFVLLFSLNLRLEIKMTDTLTVRAGIGPVMLTVVPKKEHTVDPADFTYEKHQKRLKKDRKRAMKKAEKRRLKEEKKAARKAQAEAEKKAAEKSLEEVEKKKFPLGFILALVKFVFRELDVFVGYFRTELLLLQITVGGKDAAAVGKSYGIISQSAAYLVELLRNKTRMKSIKADAVSVNADFLLEKTVYRIHIRMKLRLGNILRVGCHAIGWFIGQKIREAKRAASPAPIPAVKTESEPNELPSEESRGA